MGIGFAYFFLRPVRVVLIIYPQPLPVIQNLTTRHIRNGQCMRGRRPDLRNKKVPAGDLTMYGLIYPDNSREVILSIIPSIRPSLASPLFMVIMISMSFPFPIIAIKNGARSMYVGIPIKDTG